jgi:sulfite reductase (NADPH) flavoprotein alpha-component
MDKIVSEIISKTHLEFSTLLKEKGGALSKEQVAWLAGYFAGAAEANRQIAQAFSAVSGVGPLRLPGGVSMPEIPVTAAIGSAAATSDVTLLFASHSGNGKGFARQAQAEIEKAGIKVRSLNMASFKARDLKNEKNLLVIISTHGEGVPPPAAEELFEFLVSSRAPKLDGLHYSVLALGDKSYVHFCKAGADLDGFLEKQGAHRIFERVECDVDYADNAQKWLSGVLESLKKAGIPSASSAPAAAVESAISARAMPAVADYSPKHPYQAKVLSKINLNGRGSGKETYHIELSLEGSGITYQPGDSCGLLARNSDRLVVETLSSLKLKGGDQLPSGEAMADVLKGYELTVLTPDVLKRHNAFAKSRQLNDLVQDVSHLREYLYGRDFIDLLKDYPVEYSAADLLTVLRPIPARLYSIVSSLLEYPEEVHVLVSAVRYNAFGRNKEGVASTFWSDRIRENELVPIYIKPNDAYRLPNDGVAPIIMVGPGTGVAPFRAFVDERARRGDTGKSWLFFGNPNFTTDFLYQTEWLEHLADGTLAKMDVAFSRDQEEKVYVQHKIRQHAREVFAWIEEGAYIYVCGDIKRMAPDVFDAFVEVVEQEGGLTKEKAVEQVKGLKRSGRYLEDVY